jgi:hypothetical protein
LRKSLPQICSRRVNVLQSLKKEGAKSIEQTAVVARGKLIGRT